MTNKETVKLTVVLTCASHEAQVLALTARNMPQNVSHPMEPLRPSQPKSQAIQATSARARSQEKMEAKVNRGRSQAQASELSVLSIATCPM